MFCQTPAAPGAKFCSHCGAPLTAGTAPAVRTLPWYYNVWVVLLLLVFVLGPFGLPLVWNNPRFSPTAKWVITSLLIVYTVLLGMLTLRMIRAVQESLNAFNSTLTF